MAYLVIAKVFSAAASAETGDIETESAAALIAQLLLHPLSEEMLETVMSITDRKYTLCIRCACSVGVCGWLGR